MAHDVPSLPDGWEITPVRITDSTTYELPVAHPRGASAQAIAAAGYRDYSQEEHPATVFIHEPHEDAITVAGERQDPWGRPAWDDRRPDHDAVVAVLEATGGPWAA